MSLKSKKVDPTDVLELSIILSLGESSFDRKVRRKLGARRDKSGYSSEKRGCEGKLGVSW